MGHETGGEDDRHESGDGVWRRAFEGSRCACIGGAAAVTDVRTPRAGFFAHGIAVSAVVVFVVVPRYVQACDAVSAIRSAEESGFSARILPTSPRGHVAVEFWIALVREEEPVPDAFEIEIDNLLSRSMVPFGNDAFRRIRFSGSGARTESR